MKVVSEDNQKTAADLIAGDVFQYNGANTFIALGTLNEVREFINTRLARAAREDSVLTIRVSEDTPALGHSNPTSRIVVKNATLTLESSK